MRKTLLAAALFAFAGAASAAPVTYKIDPAHTDVIATWSHFGFSKPSAHFGDIQGSIVYDAARPEASSVEVTIPLSGLNGFSEKFNEHLNSDAFFDSARFPTASFKSTAVEALGGNKLKVTGDLTIKNVTKPVVLDATLNQVGEHPMLHVPAIGFNATATVKRSDFGVGLYAPVVSDEVALSITTEAEAAKK
jgi:polyisoprenoid-binding protein YceI